MKNNKLVYLFIVLIIIGLVVIISPAKKTETIKISDLSALTGPFALAGEMLNVSAKIAADEINSNGGINGRKIEIITEDTENDPKKAVSAYQHSKSLGAKYFIGEGSPIVSAVRPIAIADKNLVMSSAAIAPSYTDGNLLSCRFSFTSQNTGPALVALAQKYNYKNIAVLLPESEYGKTLSDEIIKAPGSQNINLLNKEFYLATANDFRTNILKLVSKQEETDALILANNSSSLETMIKQLRELGWNKPIISDNATINNPALKDLNLLNRVVYADYEYSRDLQSDDRPEVKSFKEKYKEVLGNYPPYIPAGHYDAIKLIAYAISKVGDDPKKVAKFISETKDYQGITGKLSFNSDCEANRQTVFRQVVGGKLVVE